MKAHLTPYEKQMYILLHNKKAIRLVEANEKQAQALNRLINKCYAIYDGIRQEWRAIEIKELGEE